MVWLSVLALIVAVVTLFWLVQVQDDVRYTRLSLHAALNRLKEQTMSVFDDLKAQVAANTSVEESAVLLITKIGAELQGALNNGDTAAMQDLITQLKQGAGDLGGAITANTGVADAGAAAGLPTQPASGAGTGTTTQTGSETGTSSDTSTGTSAAGTAVGAGSADAGGQANGTTTDSGNTTDPGADSTDGQSANQNAGASTAGTGQATN